MRRHRHVEFVTMTPHRHVEFVTMPGATLRPRPPRTKAKNKSTRDGRHRPDHFEAGAARNKSQNKYFQELGGREHQKHFTEAGIFQNGRVRRVFIIQRAPDSFGCVIILRSGTVLRCIIEMPLDYLSGISLHRGVDASRYLEARRVWDCVTLRRRCGARDEHIDASGTSQTHSKCIRYVLI